MSINLAHLTFEIAAHPGKLPKQMEDASDVRLIAAPSAEGGAFALALVADGIGGHAAGEEASRRAVEVVKQFFIENKPREMPQALVQSFELANDAILRQAQVDAASAGMGTTLTAAVITASELYIASVGDSRAYRLRDNKLTRLTHDHTWVQEALDSGRLTADEAAVHPNRNVLRRYLGIKESVDVDVRPVETIQTGDTLLLCSDGLIDLVFDSELKEILQDGPPKRAARNLVQLALERGGYDNITALIVQVPDPLAVPVALPPARSRHRLALIAGLIAANLLVLLALFLVLQSVVRSQIAGGAPAAALDVAAPPPPRIATTLPTERVAANPPTVTPVPTFTPVSALPGWTPAPFAPLGPINGQVFVGPGAQIILEWNATSSPLPADVYYVVTIQKFVGDQSVLQFDSWTQQTRIQLAPTLYQDAAVRYEWHVTLERLIRVNPDGSKEGAAILPPTPTLFFLWRPAPAPTMTPKTTYP